MKESAIKNKHNITFKEFDRMRKILRLWVELSDELNEFQSKYGKSGNITEIGNCDSKSERIHCD